MKRLLLKSLIWFLMVPTALLLVCLVMGFISSLSDQEKNLNGILTMGVFIVLSGWNLWKGFRLLKRLGVKQSEGTEGSMSGWIRGDSATIAGLFAMALMFLMFVLFVCLFKFGHFSI